MFRKGVMQHNENDCGVAALSTIFRINNINISPVKIRETMRVGQAGASMHALIKTAEYFGIEAIALKGTLVDLENEISTKKLSLPLIMHINNEDNRGHFIVLLKIKSNKFYIFDPAKGSQKLKSSDINKIWTGHIINFDIHSINSVKKRPVKKEKRFKFFSKYLKYEKIILFNLLGISLFTLAISILSSYLYKIIIDTIIDKTSYRLPLINIFIFLITLYFIQLILSLIQGAILSKLNIRLSKASNLEFYEKLMQLPYDFFSRFDSGSIISRFQSVSRIQENLVNFILRSGVLIASIIGSSCILILISPQLYLISLIVLLVYGVVVFLFIEPINQQNKVLQEEQAHSIKLLNESITGINSIKLTSSKEWFKTKFNIVISNLSEKISKLIKISIASEAIILFIESVGLITVFYIGSDLVSKGLISFGNLIVFNSLQVYFFTPVKELILMQKGIQEIKVLYDRLMDIMNSCSEYDLAIQIENNINHTSSNIDKYYLALNKVYFSYSLDETILEDFSLNIEKHSKIGIVGKSGSGKTTIIKLFATLLFPSSGQIIFDSQVISNSNLEQYRSKLSYVDQEPFIFWGSLYENICMNMSNIDLEWLNILIEELGIAEFSNSKLDLYLAENGRNISGGQKQKIGLARALISKPEILILDEATSKIDEHSENKIIDFINKMPNLTVISIFHNLNLIEKYEKIIYINRGSVTNIYKPQENL